MSIITAIPINSGHKMAVEEKGNTNGLLLSPEMGTKRSRSLTVITRPHIVRAYNLAVDNDCIHVLQVCEFSESIIYFKGRSLKLTWDNNWILIDIPGKYIFEGEYETNDVYLYEQEYSMSHWTAGLIHFFKGQDHENEKLHEINEIFS